MWLLLRTVVVLLVLSLQSTYSDDEVLATGTGAGHSPDDVLSLLGITNEVARSRIQARADERQVDSQPVQPASATGGWTQKRSVQRRQTVWLGDAGGSGGNVPARLANGRFCNVQRIPAAQFSRERFLREFEGRQPVILTGATDNWGALDWDFEAMLANVTLNAARMQKAGIPAATAAMGFAGDLADALQAGETPERRARKLVVDGYALSWPGLRAGYVVPEFAVRDGRQNFIEEWRGNAAAFGDLIPVLQGVIESVKTPAVAVQDRYLITGPAGAGGFPHTDVSNQSFWNALVHGRKRWFFLSGAHRDRLLQHDPVTAASWTTSNTTAYDWFNSGWAENIAAGWGYEGTGVAQLAGRHWWECYQDPGDLVYGPGGTMHAVLSLDDTLSFSEQMLGPSDFRGSISYGASTIPHHADKCIGLCISGNTVVWSVFGNEILVWLCQRKLRVVAWSKRVGAIVLSKICRFRVLSSFLR